MNAHARKDQPAQAQATVCAVDIDNVLANISDAARDHILRVHGARRADIEVTGDYERPFRWVDPARPALDFGHAFWDNDHLLASCQPLPGALEALSMLEECGQFAAYITRRTPATHGITVTWLGLHGFPSRPVLAVGDNDPKRHNFRCKSDMCHMVGANVLIDDSASEALRARANGVVPVLIDHEIGRTQRSAFLRDNPDIFIASDVLAAARHLVQERN